MKKFLTLIFIFAVAVSLTGCGTKSNENNTADTSDKDTTVDDSTNQAFEVNKFEQFETALTEKGITYEKNEKTASLVGATEGYGYIFSDGTSVELYLFDMSSNAYKEAKSSKTIKVSVIDMTLPVEINDDIAIYYNGTPAQRDVIEQIFQIFK
jgi:predicted small lipoprotein YifL